MTRAERTVHGKSLHSLAGTPQTIALDFLTMVKCTVSRFFSCQREVHTGWAFGSTAWFKQAIFIPSTVSCLNLFIVIA